jgi:GNAT superfamily N-acetyltransferase
MTEPVRIPVRLHVGAVSAASAADRFGGLLAPSLAYRQRTGLLAERLVAVVAERDGGQLGIALGQVQPGTDVGEVLCLSVPEGERRRGVGSALLARLEGALAGAGCPVVQGTYRSDWPGAVATERLLAAAGWGAPVVQKLFYKVDLRAFDALPEIRALALPGGYSVDRWDTLTDADRAHVEAILDRDQAAQPTSPFQRPDLVSEAFSVWVRHEGKIVGWMALLQPSPTVMEYSGLYVVRRHRPSRAGVAAVAAAVRRQVAAIDRHEAAGGDPGDGPPRFGIFAVEPWNGPMLAFARKWIGLPESTVTTVWLAGKRLAAGVAD